MNDTLQSFVLGIKFLLVLYVVISYRTQAMTGAVFVQKALLLLLFFFYFYFY